MFSNTRTTLTQWLSFRCCKNAGRTNLSPRLSLPSSSVYTSYRKSSKNSLSSSPCVCPRERRKWEWKSFNIFNNSFFNGRKSSWSTIMWFCWIRETGESLGCGRGQISGMSLMKSLSFLDRKDPSSNDPSGLVSEGPAFNPYCGTFLVFEIPDSLGGLKMAEFRCVFGNKTGCDSFRCDGFCGLNERGISLLAFGPSVFISLEMISSRRSLGACSKRCTESFENTGAQKIYLKKTQARIYLKSIEMNEQCIAN